MKRYRFIIAAGVLLLTACQTKQPLPETTPADTVPVTSEAFTQEEAGTKESTAADETVSEVIGSSGAVSDIITAESGEDYGVKEFAGTWRINGEKTQAVNEVSLLEEFGTGIHLGHEMILSENGDFSYYISINQGGKGTWKLEGDTITADFTTYEPEVREEQLTMTPEIGEDGELFIKMIYTDGYILFWSRLEGNSAETAEASQNETLAESNAQPGEQKVTDKNLKLEAPYVFVIDRENMDDFWDSYLPEVTIQNEWIHAADAGYSIAVFGALKDDPEQGTVNMIDVGPDNRITGSRQILAPSKGGSLSVTDEKTAKEFIMEAEDEHGTMYLFDYYNGFTAFKEGKDGDWEYRIKDGDSYEKLIAAAREYIIKHDDKIRMDYDFSTALMSTGIYEIPGYLIKDIDGNGIDELIFGENGNNPDDMWDGVVYEIYTTYNGKPVRVLKGWERSRYYFCENGILAHEGSSGAGNSSYSYFTYGESKLHLVEAVIYDGMKDADNPWFYSTESEYNAENAEPISEERAMEIRSKYVYEHPVFIPFAEDVLR